MKNDSAKIVQNDSAKIVKNDSAKIVKNDSAKIVKNDSAKIEKNDSAKIVKNDSAKIEKNDSAKIVKNDSAKIVRKTPDSLKIHLNILINSPSRDNALRRPIQVTFFAFFWSEKKFIVAITDWFEFQEYCVLLSVGDDGNKYLYLVLKALN